MTAPRAKTPILKLQTNLPLYVRLKAVYYSPERQVGDKTYAAQIKMRGSYSSPHGSYNIATGEMDADVYLADFLVNDLIRDGILRDNGVDRDGHPAFEVVERGVLEILRTENGTKKITTIRRYPLNDGATQATQTPVHMQPVHPVAIHGSQAPNITALTVTVPTVTTRLQTPNAIQSQWDALEIRYAECVKIARQCWPTDTADEVLQAATATLLIEAGKRNLPDPQVFQNAAPVTTAPLLEETPEIQRQRMEPMTRRDDARAQWGEDVPPPLQKPEWVDDDSELPF